jgi:hypothetical protein
MPPSSGKIRACSALTQQELIAFEGILITSAYRSLSIHVAIRVTRNALFGCIILIYFVDVLWRNFGRCKGHEGIRRDVEVDVSNAEA